MGAGMGPKNACASLYWRTRNYLTQRRVILPYSTLQATALLRKAGFEPSRYRNAYPDLTANVTTDEAAVLHFYKYADDDTRHFPVELHVEGLSEIARSRLPKHVKARLFAALFASYCVPWSPLWDLAPDGFDSFWSDVISLLGGQFKPFVVAGDSHCHVYCRLFDHAGKTFVPIPFICYATSARGLVSKTSRSGAGGRLSRLAQALERSGAPPPVIFKFGQVDIEFVFDFHRAQAGETAFSEEKWLSFSTKSATNYVDFVADNFSSHAFRVMGIFPPALSDDVLRAGYTNANVAGSEGIQDLTALEAALRTLDFPDRERRTRLHAEFNQILSSQTARRNIPFFDDFPYYVGPDGRLADAFIPTHRGADHHLEKQASRQTAIDVIKHVFSDMSYS
jgi:hypothetical protein